MDLVAGTSDYVSSGRCGLGGWWSWPAAFSVASTTSDVFYFVLLENVAICELCEVKGLTPGQLHSEVEAAVRQKDFGTPGLGKMSTFFQK